MKAKRLLAVLERKSWHSKFENRWWKQARQLEEPVTGGTTEIAALQAR